MSSHLMYVTPSDRRRLGSLLSKSAHRTWGAALCNLNWRLENAAAVDERSAPEDIVTMNSTVLLADLDGGETRRVTLAYPEDCELSAEHVSVLDTLGVELLGSRVGDVVCCDNRRRYRVASILYQPERDGAWHL